MHSPAIFFSAAAIISVASAYTATFYSSTTCNDSPGDYSYYIYTGTDSECIRVGTIPSDTGITCEAFTNGGSTHASCDSTVTSGSWIVDSADGGTCLGYASTDCSGDSVLGTPASGCIEGSDGAVQSFSCSGGTTS